MAMLKMIINTMAKRPAGWLLFVVLFPVVYYASLLLSMVLTFENVPNYITNYDWFGNVAEIFRATPSMNDALTIASEEWLLEIGFMNYDYGFGISEWSLNIIPLKLFLVILLALLIAINWRLYQRVKHIQVCPSKSDRRKVALTSAGLGAMLVTTGSMTMFWVVCCASPSWVVGLAMLGWVSVSTALVLDPYESYVLIAGFIFMGCSTLLLGKQVLNADFVDEEFGRQPKGKNNDTVLMNMTGGLRDA